MRPSRRTAVAVVVAVAAAVVAIAVVARHHETASNRAAIVPHCIAGPGAAGGTGAAGDQASAGYVLDLQQTANAATISAVGKRLGLPDHAVTVALAAALQESKLRNVSHGDRDSLGLFQQRPSQGWGTNAQVMDPHYAATAFYTHLSKVRGWETLSVADAAQTVQRSASGDAYAQWEPQARTLAAALTGEVAAGLACQFEPPVPPVKADAKAVAAGAAQTAAIEAAMIAELGSAELGVVLANTRGWTVASWLVGNASQYRIASVSFAGKTWTALDGTWVADPTAAGRVQIRTVPAPA